MVEPRSREGDGPSGLRVERVDLVPTELGVVLVRVAGRWKGDPAPGSPVLLVGEQRFDVLPETSGAAERAASGGDVFRATFSVPAELRPSLGIGARVKVGDVEVELPPPRDTDTGQVEPARRNVVDHATLAERRARRAEMAEEVSAERAEEAERTLAELEGDLAKLELRLDQANDERADLAARLAEALRDARTATQRAEAERRRREESVAEVSEERDEVEETAALLRERAAEASDRARELEREAEDLRRRVAEAEQTAAAAATARARAEEALAAAEAEAAETTARAEAKAAAAEAEAAEATARAEAKAAAAEATTAEALARTEAEAAEAVARLEAAAEEAVARAETGAAEAVSRAEEEAAEAIARAEAGAEERVAAERKSAARVRVETLAAERALAESLRSAEAPAAPEPAVVDPVGLGTLLGAEARVVRSRREPGDTKALREEARHAAAAVADASWTIAEARDAVGGASDAVEAERVLRLAAEQEREAVERELAGQRHLAARVEAEAASLRAEIERRTAVQAHAERAIAELRTQVEQLRGLATRAARADEAEAALREYSSAAGEALEEAERRIGEARDAAAAMQDRLEEERLERERAEQALRDELAEHVKAATAQVRDDLEARILTLAGELQAEREARATAEAALTERPPKAPPAEAPPAEAPPAEAAEAHPVEAPPAAEAAPAEAPPEAAPAEAAEAHPVEAPPAAKAAPAEAPAVEAPPAGEAAPAEAAPVAEPAAVEAPPEEPARLAPVRKAGPRTAPWLPAALRRLAVADPWAAVRLGIQLLPAQALAIQRSLDYDLHAAGLGWQAVALRPGTGTVVSVPEQRARGQADFRLSVDAPALAELLAGGGSRDVLRAGNAQIRGTLRRRRALRAIPAATLDLAEMAEAGVWPDPGLTLGALALFVDPAWTEGDEFVVALEVVGPRGGRWGVSSPGGRPVTIAPGRPQEPTATVHMPQAALHRLLAGQPGAAEGKAAIRGDVSAVSRLVEWIERAQREST